MHVSQKIKASNLIEGMLGSGTSPANSPAYTGPPKQSETPLTPETPLTLETPLTPDYGVLLRPGKEDGV